MPESRLLKWGDYAGYLERLRGHKGLIRGSKGIRVSTGGQSKRCGRLLSHGGHAPSRNQKGGEIASLVASGGPSPADTLTLAQGDWSWTSDLQDYERLDLCCFKAVSLR